MRHRQDKTEGSVVKRDYGLGGADARAAVEAGLESAQWYRTPIDPERLKTLMVRRNGRPTFDTLLWLTLLCGSGLLAFLSLGTWWFAVPAFALFGALWGGSSDARWHENGHGTAFRSQWANDAMYYVASFMLLREPTLWRWSHARHHSDTLIVGLDPEIAIQRPPSLLAVTLLYLHLINGPKLLRLMLKHACGRGDELTQVAVPTDQFRRVVWEAVSSSPCSPGWSPPRSRWGRSCRSFSLVCHPSMAPGWRSSSPSPSTPACERTCSTTG